MKRNLGIVHLSISGADFLCIPVLLTDSKPRYYKLCWVKKISDNIYILTFEYEVICYVETIKEAKERANWFLEYFST